MTLAYYSDWEPLRIDPKWPYGGDEVTIGIGALCQRGNCAIVASDMRASFGSNLKPHDAAGKQWDMDVRYPLVACVAGVFGICQPTVDELNNHLATKVPEKDVYCEHIENAIDSARYRTFYRFVDWQLKMAYGLTLKEWHRGKVKGGKMHKQIHDEVRAFIHGVKFPVELILAGFLPNGDIAFFKASQKRRIECSSSPGVYVIGTGGTLAMDHLNKRAQNIDRGLLTTLLHTSEALEEARKVPDGSVGHAQAFTIIWRNGDIVQLPADSPTLTGWRNAYKNRADTTSLDESDVAWQQIKHQLYKHRPTPSRLRKSKGPK
jgi:hypothetical protein